MDGFLNGQNLDYVIFEWSLRIKSDICNNEDIMVVAGDMMFQDQKFDLRFIRRIWSLLRFHLTSSLAYYSIQSL